MSPQQSFKTGGNSASAAAPSNLSAQGQQGASNLNPIEDARNYMMSYARQKPEAAALWCFGIGFLLGWKLKPW